MIFVRYADDFIVGFLKPGLAPSEDIRKRVEDSVIREIGPIARPRRVVMVPRITRSGGDGGMVRISLVAPAQQCARDFVLLVCREQHLSCGRVPEGT